MPRPIMTFDTCLTGELRVRCDPEAVRTSARRRVGPIHCAMARNDTDLQNGNEPLSSWRTWLIGAALALIAIARWNLLVAWALAVLGIYLSGAVWRVRRRRRAQREIRAALEQAGYETLHMQHRYWRTGPFSTWKTTSHSFVFRTLVRQAGGVPCILWAKWGRDWFGCPDKLEIRSETKSGEPSSC